MFSGDTAGISHWLRARSGIFSLLSVFFVVYAILAWHAHPSDLRWNFDVIEGLHQHAIDDAYRFFETRSAWYTSGLWGWAYLLPVDAVFKGILHSVTESSIFLMRLAHVGVNILGVYFLYASCLLLGVRKSVAFIACLSLLAFPIYATVSMSFYGESLLTAFSSIAIYLYLRNKINLFCLVASLMPLIQLQGLHIISGFFIYFMIRKEWKFFLYLMMPGFFYFLFVMYVHGGVFEFLSFSQLHKLYPALPVPIQERGWIGAVETINPILCLIAVSGMIVCWRNAWPFLFGSVFWFLLVSTVMTYYNGYEPRYLLPSLPAFLVAYAVGINYFLGKLRLLISLRWGWGFTLLIAFPIIIENLGQSDVIRANYLGEKRWPIGQPHIGSREFLKITTDDSVVGNDAARRIESFLSENTDYKLLVVNQHNLFYYLDRSNMPEDVRVLYTPFPPLLAVPAFQGRFYAMSPDHPQASFYTFSNQPEFSERALFVGDFSVFGWQVAYRNKNFSIHELWYDQTTPPEQIYVIHRMGRKNSDASQYKTKNLCPEQKDYICPDWRSWNLF